MDHYIDVRVKADAEMSENRLMNLTVTKLHKALVHLKTSRIGVSFPKSRIKLGDTLRLHGRIDTLNQLQEQTWLGNLAGYCEVSNILQIPEQVMHRTVSRKQPTMSKSKLKRLKNRGTIEHEQEKIYKAKLFAQGLDEPYLEFVSSSNGHKHRRYVSFGELVKIPAVGLFDTFGFSNQATIPWF